MARFARTSLALWMLGGCAAAPDLVGLGAGGAAGAATSNPAVALIVGISVRTAVREGMGYANRTRSTTKQQALAEVAGGLAVGEAWRWQAEHVAGIGNSAGDVQILREITTPLATCKEVALRVDDVSDIFVTSICPYGSGWAWAGAEPAVARWGSLQ